MYKIGKKKRIKKKKPKTGPKPSPRMSYDVKIGPKPGPRGLNKFEAEMQGSSSYSLIYPLSTTSVLTSSRGGSMSGT